VASHYCPSSPCPICAAPLIEAALSNANRPFEPFPVPLPSSDAARELLAAAEALLPECDYVNETRAGEAFVRMRSAMQNLRAAVANMKETMR
jgi:hypothetical protein